jgi:hypothetical protein
LLTFHKGWYLPCILSPSTMVLVIARHLVALLCSTVLHRSPATPLVGAPLCSTLFFFFFLPCPLLVL